MTPKPLSKDARYHRDLLNLATKYPHRIRFETTMRGVTRAFTTSTSPSRSRGGQDVGIFYWISPRIGSEA